MPEEREPTIIEVRAFFSRTVEVVARLTTSIAIVCRNVLGRPG
jgi:hypothetical protein